MTSSVTSEPPGAAVDPTGSSPTRATVVLVLGGLLLFHLVLNWWVIGRDDRPLVDDSNEYYFHSLLLRNGLVAEGGLVGLPRSSVELGGPKFIRPPGVMLLHLPFSALGLDLPGDLRLWPNLVLLALLALSVYGLEEMLKDRWAGMVGAAVALTLPIIAAQGRVVMADLPMAAGAAAVAFLSLGAAQATGRRWWVWLVVLTPVLGLAAAFKLTSPLFVAGPLLWLLVSSWRRARNRGLAATAALLPALAFGLVWCVFHRPALAMYLAPGGHVVWVGGGSGDSAVVTVAPLSLQWWTFYPLAAWREQLRWWWAAPALIAGATVLLVPGRFAGARRFLLVWALPGVVGLVAMATRVQRASIPLLSVAAILIGWAASRTPARLRSILAGAVVTLGVVSLGWLTFAPAGLPGSAPRSSGTEGVYRPAPTNWCGEILYRSLYPPVRRGRTGRARAVVIAEESRLLHPLAQRTARCSHGGLPLDLSRIVRPGRRRPCPEGGVGPYSPGGWSKLRAWPAPRIGTLLARAASLAIHLPGARRPGSSPGDRKGRTCRLIATGPEGPAALPVQWRKALAGTEFHSPKRITIPGPGILLVWHRREGR